MADLGRRKSAVGRMGLLPKPRHRGRLWNTVFLYDVVVFVVVALHNLMHAVVAPYVDHWCHQPEYDLSLTTEEWKNMSIPRTKDGSYSHCTMYRNISEEDSGEIYCTEWDYESNYTIISEWDLVCDRAHLKRAAFVIYMLGSITGAVIAGPLSDKIGRRPVICLSSVILEVFGLAVHGCSDIYTFIVLRFFVGFAVTGIYAIAFVLLAEAVGKRQRAAYVVNAQYGFTVGTGMVGLLSDYKLDWRTYQLVAMFPSTVLLMSFVVVPESPRWLEMNEVNQVQHTGSPNPEAKGAESAHIKKPGRRKKRFLVERLGMLASRELRYINAGIFST